MFEPARSFQRPSGGVCMRRQVMYYLESNPTLCLIRVWLRRAVTSFLPHVQRWMSAHKWRWTSDLQAELGLNSHTLNPKGIKCIKHAHTDKLYQNTLLTRQLWDNLQPQRRCLKHEHISVREYRYYVRTTTTAVLVNPKLNKKLRAMRPSAVQQTCLS